MTRDLVCFARRAERHVVFTRGRPDVIHFPTLVRAGSGAVRSIFTFLFKTLSRQILDNTKCRALQLFAVHIYQFARLLIIRK